MDPLVHQCFVNASKALAEALIAPQGSYAQRTAMMSYNEWWAKAWYFSPKDGTSK